MAYTGNVTSPITKTFLATTDLSDKDGYAVALSADETVALATTATAPAFPLVDGQDRSTTTGDVGVAIAGVANFKLGGTVTVGAKITPTTGGKWIATTSDTNNYGGIALKAGVANDLIPAIVIQGMIAG